MRISVFVLCCPMSSFARIPCTPCRWQTLWAHRPPPTPHSVGNVPYCLCFREGSVCVPTGPSLTKTISVARAGRLEAPPTHLHTDFIGRSLGASGPCLRHSPSRRVGWPLAAFSAVRPRAAAKPARGAAFTTSCYSDLRRGGETASDLARFGCRWMDGWMVW